MVPFLGDKPFVFKLNRDQLCASVSEDLILCGWNDILHGQTFGCFGLLFFIGPLLVLFVFKLKVLLRHFAISFPGF